MDITNNGINFTKGSEDINKNNIVLFDLRLAHQKIKSIIIDNKEGILLKIILENISMIMIMKMI